MKVIIEGDPKEIRELLDGTVLSTHVNGPKDLPSWTQTPGRIQTPQWETSPCHNPSPSWQTTPFTCSASTTTCCEKELPGGISIKVIKEEQTIPASSTSKEKEASAFKSKGEVPPKEAPKEGATEGTKEETIGEALQRIMKELDAIEEIIKYDDIDTDDIDDEEVLDEDSIHKYRVYLNEIEQAIKEGISFEDF